MRGKVKSVFGPCWSLSGSCLMQQQQSSATLSLSLYHLPCECTPVWMLHWGFSGALWESLSLPASPPPPSHPTQPTQQERWRYSHKWEKNKTKPVMYSKWRKHVYLKSEGEIPGKSVTSCCWKGRSKEIWKGRCSYTRPVGWDSGGNVHNGKIKKCSLMRGGWDEQ